MSTVCSWKLLPYYHQSITYHFDLGLHSKYLFLVVSLALSLLSLIFQKHTHQLFTQPPVFSKNRLIRRLSRYLSVKILAILSIPWWIFLLINHTPSSSTNINSWKQSYRVAIDSLVYFTMPYLITKNAYLGSGFIFSNLQIHDHLK